MAQNGREASLGLRIAVVIGIALLFPSAIYYGVGTFAGRPEAPRYQVVDSSLSKEDRQKALEAREKKRKTYQEAQAVFSNTLFWVAVPLGLLAALLGLFPRLGDIGTGFVIGGMITIGEGHWGSWRFISDDLRFYSLVIGLVVLLVVGYRRLSIS